MANLAAAKRWENSGHDDLWPSEEEEMNKLAEKTRRRALRVKCLKGSSTSCDILRILDERASRNPEKNIQNLMPPPNKRPPPMIRKTYVPNTTSGGRRKSKSKSKSNRRSKRTRRR